MSIPNKRKLIKVTPEEFNEYLEKIYFTKEDIDKRASELSQRINEDFQSIDIIFSLLSGAKVWTDTLKKEGLKSKKEIYTDLSFYNKGYVELKSDSRVETTNCFNKKVLVIDDLVSKGRTLSYVLRNILENKPKKLAVCVMIQSSGKLLPENEWISKFVKYKGFVVPKDDFLVGYGIGTLNPTPKKFKYLDQIYKLKNIPEGYNKLNQ